MDKIFDVIVLGGGPAGLGSALNTSTKELSVLLLERGKIGNTEKTWLTFDYVLEKYGLKECIQNRFSEVNFSCYLGNTYSFKTGDFIYPIDEPKALRILAKKARDAGATIKENEEFISYSYDKKSKLTTILTDKSSYKCRLSVDAMGRGSQILKSNGLHNHTVDMGCLSYFFKNSKYKEQNKMTLYDSFYPGSDYFWLIPLGNSKVMAGIFRFSPLDDSSFSQMKGRLEDYIRHKKIGGKLYDVKKGNIPLGSQNNINAGPILCIGDSCNTPLPSSGFSFNRCLDESEILAGFAFDHIKGEVSLDEYKNRILGSKIPSISIHLIISDMLAKFTNPMLNKAIGEMNNLPEEFIRSFLTGRDMSVSFAATVLQTILKIFTLQEIKSLSLQHNYLNTLINFYNLIPGIRSAGIRKQLTDFIKKYI